ncbi:hypothetical protein HPB49_018257 [Dermacentor silvarum]|uniref:Uncharacterized protein n=1 Tax=Dermacentor silvarum TaxID=543639 RepID=A0ACB8E2E6_DERSI|nr:hypothetical protein HPB49_018257 [Dermacentor silvarum]
MAENGLTEHHEDELEEEEEGGLRIADIYVPPPPPAACTFSPTGPRLMIQKIENINFKSYAGTRIIGPFHKNFTAIVGPNGSGKSNVIDSMLFVFGYRAQKIRSKEVGVLIHNSTNHTNLDSCTVNVYFQRITDTDENTFEVEENSEFVVGRTAHRDNTSYYTLNRAKLVEKDMEELKGARDEAVEFLKLENDIAVIENQLFQFYRRNEKTQQAQADKQVKEAQAQMVELKKELDTQQQAQKVQQAELKKALSAYSQSEAVVLSPRRGGGTILIQRGPCWWCCLLALCELSWRAVVMACAKRLNLPFATKLKIINGVERGEKKSDVTAAYKIPRSTLSTIRRTRQTSGPSRTKGQVPVAPDVCAPLCTKMSKRPFTNGTISKAVPAGSNGSKNGTTSLAKLSCSDSLDNMEACVLSQAAKSLKQKIHYYFVPKECEKKQKEVDAKKQEYAEFECRDLQCRETIKHTKQKGKELEKNLESAKEKVQDLKKQPEKLQKDIEKLQAKKEMIEKEKVEAEAKLAEVMESLKTQTDELQEQKAVHEQELLGLQKGVSEKKSQYEIAKLELDLSVSTYQREMSRLEEIELNLEQVNNLLTDKSSCLTRLEKLVPEKEAKLKQLEAEITQVGQQYQESQEQLRADRHQVEELCSNAQANRSRSRVLDSLLQAKKSGRLPGVIGRLGDLGAIDEKYDVAISTACDQLDYVVTDTVLTAQHCVEYLKKHDVGFANFIALEKMECWIPYTQNKINTPENVPRLFDLVSVKNTSLLPAFYFALQDTLVANDLDQATRIGLQGRTRHRVVTLQGELVDVSGTMSGGGGCVLHGKMGQAVLDDNMSAEQMEQLTSQLTALENKARDLHERCSVLEDKINSLRKDVTASKHALQKFQVEVKSLKQQQMSLTSQLAEQKEKVIKSAPDKKQLAQQEKAVAAYKKEYDQAMASWNKMENKVLELHAKIMEITGKCMGSVQQKVESITKQLDAASMEITRAQSSIKASERSHTKSAKHCGIVQMAAGNSIQNYLAPSTSEESTGLAPSQATHLNSTCKSHEVVTDAEILWTLKVITSHYSYRSSAQTGDFFKQMFPDSDVAKSFSCGEKKNAPNDFLQEKQRDVHVHYGDSSHVATRYYTSAFMGHSTAEDIQGILLSGLEPLPLGKILQISMDGPNVSLKFFRNMQVHLQETHQVQCVDLGTCGLHTIHNAYRAGVGASKWGIDVLLSSLSALFQDSPA